MNIGCTEYCKGFTVALKIIDDVDKKEMYHSVIAGNEYASKDWNCIASMFLKRFNDGFLFGYGFCVYVLKLLSVFYCVYVLKLLSALSQKSLSFI